MFHLNALKEDENKAEENDSMISDDETMEKQQSNNVSDAYDTYAENYETKPKNTDRLALRRVQSWDPCYHKPNFKIERPNKIKSFHSNKIDDTNSINKITKPTPRRVQSQNVLFFFFCVFM